MINRLLPISTFIVLLCLKSMASCFAAEEVPSAAVLAAEQARIDVMQRVSASVVAVFGAESTGGGSGVLISPDGFALTNFHVVKGAGPFLKCGLNDGVLYDAVQVGIDPTGDVAVIKLLGRDDFPVADFGDSDELRVGDQVFAMGNPFLLATDFHPTVTFGIVSGLHRYQEPSGTILEYTDCIQIDASINPGNSGGPLFNLQGELVGINGRASFEKRGRVNVGAAYAISINQIRHFLDSLKGGRIVDHATLGATVTSDSLGRVIVAEIREATDAYRKGLRLNDEIVSFANRPIGSVNQFKNILGIYPSGVGVPLVYRRDGLKKSIDVRLNQLHSPSELIGFVDDWSRGTPEKNLESPQPQSKGYPDKWKDLFEPRSGFVNFHFNRVRRDPLLKTIAEWKKSGEIGGLWTIRGKTEQNIPVTIKINNVGAGLILGADQFYQQYGEGVELKDEPPGTGGLLASLQHLRLLLTAGDGAFTDCSYWGTERTQEGRSMVDIVRCEMTGAISYWYFRPQDRICLGFRFQLSEDAGFCEVSWNELQSFGGLDFPKVLSVRGPENSRWSLLLEAVEIAAPTAPTNTDPPKGGEQSD